MKELFDKLRNEFSDREYAHAYMESHLVTRLAAQIFALRKQRGWSQEKLAHESGIAQETISKIESGDFDSITLKTLRKFSRAFDVHAHASFIPFSTGILDTSNLTPKRLEALPREADLSNSKAGVHFYSFKGDWQMTVPIESNTVASITAEIINPESFKIAEAVGS